MFNMFYSMSFIKVLMHVEQPNLFWALTEMIGLMNDSSRGGFPIFEVGILV